MQSTGLELNFPRSQERHSNPTKKIDIITFKNNQNIRKLHTGVKPQQ